ncbi:MAG: glycoside hydrolase family 3 C-terminal domain-containing protein [Blautia sp.]|nr:glycoside hydrolase family 3 C-terminal domain-containing protein [Blautia sp.]MCM1202427.1 glycoside hydrolase family 3 C-terminal domain-containing protein [Bacteroides fragilis]
MKKKERTYSGTKNNAVTERELRNRRIAKEAAAEGMVLLKNDGVLPMKKGQKAALFGGAAVATVKGGTGSGDVNEREVVSVYQGFVDGGIALTNREWLDSFQNIYREARIEWRDSILHKLKENKESRLLDIYSANVFRMPAGMPIKEADAAEADIAFYVIGRTAGEAADRFNSPGDYELTEQEKEELAFLSAHCENLAVIVNAGGVIDLRDILALPNLKALLSIVQPGMEGGHALADIVTGKVTPSGKLTDTWALAYEDYPNAETFSHQNGNVEKEYYEEGIYVGYRYFDSFGKETAYPFGYGLSYTDFSIAADRITAGENGAGNPIVVQAVVTNTGNTYSGREVLQVYASCPQNGLEKEYRRLCGFAKTKLLAPGESQQLTVCFDAKSLASYDEKRSAWVAEAGRYGIWIGNSSRNLTLSAVLSAEEDYIIERVSAICPLKEELRELTCPQEQRLEREKEWHRQAEEKRLPVLPFVPKEQRPASEEQGMPASPGTSSEQTARELVEKLTDEQLTAMVIGEVSKGQGQALGAAGIMVPGAAGETSSALEEEYDVPGVSMADGPAGLRLMKSYEVDRKTGEVYSEGILGALEGGLFSSGKKHEGAEIYYQYCTAIPVGTLLAQTWNVELMEKAGRAVAEEMQEFQVSWWLAPGMNIHRNPLCGRNFEYYSEDPIVSGQMAAAITRGVQSVPGTGTTIKHFACNNQEDNRMGSDSILSERALREIYLRGFEIAVKTAQPMAMMTSYNLINGVHAANNRDLCTQAARKEWGFRGLIMTDWTTTEARGGSESWRCAWAGNDLIMPGSVHDGGNILEALREGKLGREELKACVVRILTVIFQTLAYEDAVPYGEQFR